MYYFRYGQAMFIIRQPGETSKHAVSATEERSRLSELDWITFVEWKDESRESGAVFVKQRVSTWSQNIGQQPAVYSVRGRRWIDNTIGSSWQWTDSWETNCSNLFKLYLFVKCIDWFILFGKLFQVLFVLLGCMFYLLCLYVSTLT